MTELFSAYLKYAKNIGINAELLESSEGHVIAKLNGTNVGLAFQHEGGQHCCQRVPETETKGRKQTSYVKVGILPIREETYDPIPDSDFETTTQTGHGKGGQHQNKTESAVRMKHLPTGLSVFINGRDQHANKREARKILTARVAELRKAENNSDYAANRRQQMGEGNRGDKIRTYNFMEGRVVDHRLNTKTGNVKGIMKGDFHLLFPSE